MISFELVVKECKVCHNQRKMVKGSLRDQNSICGNCWWGPDGIEDPTQEIKQELTDEQLHKMRKLLQKV